MVLTWGAGLTVGDCDMTVEGLGKECELTGGFGAVKRLPRDLKVTVSDWETTVS